VKLSFVSQRIIFEKINKKNKNMKYVRETRLMNAVDVMSFVVH